MDGLVECLLCLVLIWLDGLLLLLLLGYQFFGECSWLSSLRLEDLLMLYLLPLLSGITCNRLRHNRRAVTLLL